MPYTNKKKGEEEPKKSEYIVKLSLEWKRFEAWPINKVTRVLANT